MEILRKSEITKKKEEGELREYYFFPDFDNFEFVVTHMPPGKRQKSHGHNEVNEAIYVISGKINVKQNDTEEVLKSGDAALFEKGKLHTIANKSENDAPILTIKQPRKPDDKFYGTSIMENSPNQGALLTALEQNWLHARHVENERLWFTSIYAAIIAGSLSLLIRGNTPLLGVPIPLLGFFILLSVIGFIISLKLGLEFHQHITFATEIAKNKKVDLEKWMGKPLGLYEFSVDATRATKFKEDLDKGVISEEQKKIFKKERFPLSENTTVRKRKEKWKIIDGENVYVIREKDKKLNIEIDIKTGRFLSVGNWFLIFYIFCLSGFCGWFSCLCYLNIEFVRNIFEPILSRLYISLNSLFPLPVSFIFGIGIFSIIFIVTNLLCWSYLKKREDKIRKLIEFKISDNSA